MQKALLEALTFVFGTMLFVKEVKFSFGSLLVCHIFNIQNNNLGGSMDAEC